MDRNTAVGGNKPTGEYLSEGAVCWDADLGKNEQVTEKSIEVS